MSKDLRARSASPDPGEAHEDRADATFARMFPADDPVAQFVLVLCAQSNDLGEAVRQVVRQVERDGAHAQYYHRLLLSHYFEAARWLVRTMDRTEAVSTWLEDASAYARARLTGILATTGKGRLVESVLWAGRGVTFHYPEPLADGLPEALTELRDARVLVSTEKDEAGWYAHYQFAEEVMTNRVFHRFGPDISARISELQQAAIRYVEWTPSFGHRRACEAS